MVGTVVHVRFVVVKIRHIRDSVAVRIHHRTAHRTAHDAVELLADHLLLVSNRLHKLGNQLLHLLRVLDVDRLGFQLFVGSQSVADRLVKKFEVVDWREYV